ncbi:efflux RND transporter periplasmic adaptor subunit [Mucilaginibacter phyllosphaerae]|uniref:Efflux RND transporter periplasmic adaptor subunit n=1 Tax=Mucilaginibacter phyllosphaerae TaxID=1812349 RepID=A0A4Y8AFQ2_9SPHI|nr:efflux RND transporter periplasmic adaptor subunit [Mucilaginibacter phyllosphaerae]MBB3971264.1 RND family efflux transporter MFP subunit [Mucilaginibacter phyllosphaerae]TEW66839.1 efflux RND transporter periplasmic adaptor subunit [Mucilaginibacter phyllosphaerae]
MKLIFKPCIYLMLMLMAGMVTSCTQQEKPKEADTEKEAAPAQANTVSLTTAQIKTAGIELGKIEMKNLATAIKANGLLSVPNQNKALVTSVTNGTIKTLTVQPGNYVNKGQVIATILNPDIAQLQQASQTTQAQLTLAQQEYERQKELVAGNAAPLKNLQKAEAELAALKSTKRSQQLQLSAMGISQSATNSGRLVTSIPVVAPISGTVSEVSAQIGSNVDASTPIAQIVNNSQLHLDLFVFEKDLPKVKAGQRIHFTLTNSAGKEYDAKIYSIGTAFASQSKTIPVHAVVMGDKTGLIEGMNVTAIISIGNAVLPAVPSEAIVSNGGQDYIFMVKKQDAKETLFERVPVAKGVSDIGFTEITPVKNLKPGSTIVIKKTFFVLAKMVNTGEEE